MDHGIKVTSKNMKTLTSFMCTACLLMPLLARAQAVVEETTQVVKTYPFSDPDPVADPGRLYYPYFRFDGFAATGVDKPWKTITLENEYVSLTLYPEVGGKIWGAIDKTSGKEFIYHNEVVKFRDIAMRGPWTSGGIEFNFGIIGHAPTSSTPVDYLTRTKEDGSVSCYIASYDWITRTVWQVEVNLPKDKAYFTTTTTWYNQSALDQPYYQWMNAGYPAAGNAQFCYPGNRYIGHGGDAHTFPLDEKGRDISWYEKNNFGSSKSYHVLGYYNDYYGIYWHDDDFGSVHHAGYDEKLGMKIFLWSQARDGGIWEDLLTDTHGQYIELQSGRMYNQPASNSALTPYKHYAFGPGMTDQWTEYWFPVKGIQGISKASRIGALHVERAGGDLKLAFSPLTSLSTTLKIYDGEKEQRAIPLATKVLEPWKTTLSGLGSIGQGELRIVIGDGDLVYTERKNDYELNRPTELPAGFDWNSVYGLYTQGEQWMNQKENRKAEHYLSLALEKDSLFAPALNRLASLYYREGRAEASLGLLRRSLGVNAYDGEANYLYGLCNRAQGHAADAKDGFSVASYSPAFRSAAFLGLAEISLQESDWKKAEHYALKSLDYNRMNLGARQALTVAYRKSGQTEKARRQIDEVLSQWPLYHFARYEKLCLDRSEEAANHFSALIRNELAWETYLELGGWYESAGCFDEAMELFSFAGGYPIADYRIAYLLHRQGLEKEAEDVLKKADITTPAFVFPFRPETAKALEWAAGRSTDWKPDYYLALVCWANNDLERAAEFMKAAGNPPFAPFYLTRARLTGQLPGSGFKAVLEDLLKAEQAEMSWRTGFALLTAYGAEEAWPEVVAAGERYMKKFPDNYYIGLKLAKGYCETGRYAACIRLLTRLEVLPNEGAYAGRSVYRAAHLFQAMDYLGRRNYAKALASVKASGEWPENLGVGKPYDELIDTRLETYIQARILAGEGQSLQAGRLFEQVAAHPADASHFRSADLLTALALKAAGRAGEADRRVAAWKEAHPDNRIVEWCTAVYRGEPEKAAALLESRRAASDATPWESSFRDMDFDLLVRLFR